MPRTAPGPNAIAIPGMNPGTILQGGGGDGGGGSGKGGSGSGKKKGAGTGDGQEDASADEKNGGCAEGDPVCPITGRMFIDLFDFGSSGPLPLRFLRSYNSRAADRAGQFGYGWSHAFSWSLKVRRRSTHVFDAAGREQIFAGVPKAGSALKNGLGFRLSVERGGITLRRPGEDVLVFGPAAGDEHHLIACVDRNDNRIVLHRDELGRLCGMTDSVGRPYKVTLDTLGRIQQVRIARNEGHSDWLVLATYQYDPNGDLASFTDAGGYTAHYRYDNHLLVEHRSVSGLSYFYVFDAKTPKAYCTETWGEFVGQADPALEHPIEPAQPRPKVKGIQWRRFEYDKEGRYCEVEDSLGGVSRYFGDEAGRAVKIVDAAGGVTVRIYDPESGAVTATSDPSQSNQNVDVDREGRDTYRSTNGDRGVARWTDDEGTEHTYNELTGALVRRRYDERANMLWEAHPDGTWEEFQYDERGLLTHWIDRNGAAHQYEYDGRACLIHSLEPGDLEEFAEYDYLGRIVTHFDSNGAETKWEWDDRSEIIRKQHADGSEIRVGYDANRKPVSLVDGGRITRYEYGGIGWLTRAVGPDGREWQVKHDTEGNRTKLVNPRGQVFPIERDHVGRCVRYRTFEGTEFFQAHNHASKVISIAGPEQRCAFEYDGDNLLAEVGLPEGDDLLSYSKSGGLAAISGFSVPIAREYDPMGRVSKDRQGDHENGLLWGGSRLKRVVSDVGAPVEYEYHPSGNVRRIRCGRASVDLNQESARDTLNLVGHGVVHRRRANENGLLVFQSLARCSAAVPLEQAALAGDPNAFFWVEYEYDATQTLIRETYGDGRRVEYETTPSAQVLVKRTWRGSQLVLEERVGYDAAGTPLLPGVRFDQAMRPSEYNGERLEYDAEGRLVKRLADDGEWRYEWNGYGQLSRVAAPRHVVEMEYDARGRRMKKRVLSESEVVSSTSYLWTENVVAREINDLDGSTRTYLRDNDRWEIIGHVDATAGGDSVCYYVLKPNGGIDFAIDETGAVVWNAEQSLYGDAHPTVEAVDVRLRFVNQFYDADVGLVYNRSRWYDPRVGLYVSCDHRLLGGTLNPRDYAWNPAQHADPTGEAVDRRIGSGSGGRNYHPTPADSPTPRPSGIDNTAAGADYLGNPGHWATEGTPATPGYANCPSGALDEGAGFGSDFDPSSAQGQVNAAGTAYGCHSCGSRDSGYPDKVNAKGETVQHWTCDHQPPRSTYNETTAAAAHGQGGAATRAESRKQGAVRLYPHCQRCSNAQKTAMSAATSTSAGRVQAARDGLAQMRANRT